MIKHRPPSPLARTVTPAAFATLQRDLQDCTNELARVKREIEIHFRRMAAMQAEIDHLRERTRS